MTTVVQTKDAAGPGLTLNFSSNVTIGNSVVVWIGDYNTSGAAISSSAPTYNGASVTGATKLLEVQNGVSGTSNVMYLAIWLLPNVQSSGTSVTITAPTNGSHDANSHYYLAEVSGLGASPVVDSASPNPKTASSTAGGAVTSGATGNAVGTSGIVLGGMMQDGANSGWTGPAGWTTLTDSYAGASYQVFSSSGASYTWSSTGSGAGQWAAGAVILDAAASSNVNGAVANVSVAAPVGTASVSTPGPSPANVSVAAPAGTASSSPPGTVYTVWNNTLPDVGTASVGTGQRNDSLVFTVSSSCTLTGIAFYVPSGETVLTGSSYTAALYTTTTGTSGSLVTSAAGSGTFTAGAWNWIPFSVSLSPGTTYSAVINSPDAIQYEHSWWGTGGPGVAGITSGPINCPGQSTAPGNVQQGFLAGALAFPGVANANGSWYGVDVQVTTASTANVNGAVANVSVAAPVGTASVSATYPANTTSTIAKVGDEGITGTSTVMGISYISHGGTLILEGCWFDASNTSLGLTGVTDDAGNTWHFSATNTSSDVQDPPSSYTFDAGGSFGNFIAWCINATPITQVQMHSNTGIFWHANVSEWTGIGSDGPGASGHGAGNGVALASPSVTLADTGDLVIGGTDAKLGITGGASGASNFTNDPGAAGYLVFEAPGTTGPFQFSWPDAHVGDPYSTAVKVFRPASVTAIPNVAVAAPAGSPGSSVAGAAAVVTLAATAGVVSVTTTGAPALATVSALAGTPGTAVTASPASVVIDATAGTVSISVPGQPAVVSVAALLGSATGFAAGESLLTVGMAAAFNARAAVTSQATLEFQAGQPVQPGMTTLAADPWVSMYASTL